MGSIGDPTTVGDAKGEGTSPQTSSAAADSSAGPTDRVATTAPTLIATSTAEGTPVTVASAPATTESVTQVPGALDLAAVRTASEATQDVSVETAGAPESHSVETAEPSVHATPEVASSVVSAAGGPTSAASASTVETADGAVSAVATSTAETASNVVPEAATPPNPAPTPPTPAPMPVVTPAVSQAAVAAPAPSTSAGRAPTGPGGGKRRKPGQVEAPVSPEWVVVPTPRPQSFLGGPAIWGVIAIISVLLAGTVLSNGAFTPFAVDTVSVATNALTSDLIAVAPGRVQTTAITLGDLTPGTTVVRAPFAVKAESPGTGKPLAAYVSVVTDKPADHVRVVVFRCLDAGGAPASCDTAVGFSDAHLDTGGVTPLLIETSGGPPTPATVRAASGADLEILDGAGNVKKGGRVRGVAPVARPAQGTTAKLADFFVVGGTTGGLGHGAQDVGVSGATATLPMVKGIPGLPPGGQSYLLSYFYALPDTPAADATAKVGVTVAVLAISADPTP